MYNYFESKLKSALKKLDEDFSPGKGGEFNRFHMKSLANKRTFYHLLPEVIKVAINDVLDYEDIDRIYNTYNGGCLVISKLGPIYEFDAQGNLLGDREDDIDMIDFDDLNKSKGRSKF